MEMNLEQYLTNGVENLVRGIVRAAMQGQITAAQMQRR